MKCAYLPILSLFLLFSSGVNSAADICEILDANYCFYFSDSSCYIELCKCEACSKPDEVESLLLDSDSESDTNSTLEKLCPTWCPHIKNNEKILNILGSSNHTSLEEISFDCDDLKKNCLANKGYNGHCYFHEKQCEFNHAISMRGKNKKEKNQHHECLKYQRKCHSKYRRHYSCRQMRKTCRTFKKHFEPTNSTADNSTIIITNNTTTIGRKIKKSPLERCLNLQRLCFDRYPKHFACRQFNKKCQEFSLPPLSSTIPTATITVTTRPKKLTKKSGNSTIIVTAGGQFVNSSLVDEILRL